MPRLRLLLLPMLAALSGCAVYPAGPAYVSPPVAGVYVAPRPYYYPPPSYGYGGWGHRPWGYGPGWRRW